MLRHCVSTISASKKSNKFCSQKSRRMKIRIDIYPLGCGCRNKECSSHWKSAQNLTQRRVIYSIQLKAIFLAPSKVISFHPFSCKVGTVDNLMYRLDRHTLFVSHSHTHLHTNTQKHSLAHRHTHTHTQRHTHTHLQSLFASSRLTKKSSPQFPQPPTMYNRKPWRLCSAPELPISPVLSMPSHPESTCLSASCGWNCVCLSKDSYVPREPCRRFPAANHPPASLKWRMNTSAPRSLRSLPMPLMSLSAPHLPAVLLDRIM